MDKVFDASTGCLCTFRYRPLVLCPSRASRLHFHTVVVQAGIRRETVHAPGRPALGFPTASDQAIGTPCAMTIARACVLLSAYHGGSAARIRAIDALHSHHR